MNKECQGLTLTRMLGDRLTEHVSAAISTIIAEHNHTAKDLAVIAKISHEAAIRYASGAQRAGPKVVQAWYEHYRDPRLLIAYERDRSPHLSEKLDELEARLAVALAQREPVAVAVQVAERIRTYPEPAAKALLDLLREVEALRQPLQDLFGALREALRTAVHFMK